MPCDGRRRHRVQDGALRRPGRPPRPGPGDNQRRVPGAGQADYLFAVTRPLTSRLVMALALGSERGHNRTICHSTRHGKPATRNRDCTIRMIAQVRSFLISALRSRERRFESYWGRFIIVIVADTGPQALVLFFAVRRNGTVTRSLASPRAGGASNRTARRQAPSSASAGTAEIAGRPLTNCLRPCGSR